jgi:hypothetical protein
VCESHTVQTTEITMSRPLARHWFGAYRSPATGACVCACCGASPWEVSPRPASEMVGESFSEPGLLVSPYAPEVCAGCAGLLGGKPGDVPTPFRMLHALATPHGVRVLTLSELHALIDAPPPGRFALVFATSKKRHAWLHSEVCDASRIVVGTDDGPAVFEPAHRPALEAVAALVAWFSRDAIRLGQYPAPSVSRMGAAAWSAAEAAVAPLRPSRTLDLLCAITPRPEVKPAAAEEEPVMLDPDDEDAATLLTAIAVASQFRVNRGLDFWGGVYSHRVQRFARLPLPDMISRLIAELRVPPHHAAPTPAPPPSGRGGRFWSPSPSTA